MIYRQLLLTFIASKNLKNFSYCNYVLKRANDLKTISNWLVLLSRCVRNSAWMRIVPEPLRHTIEIWYLTGLAFSVRTVSYGSSFFPLRFMAGDKNSVRGTVCMASKTLFGSGKIKKKDRSCNPKKTQTLNRKSNFCGVVYGKEGRIWEALKIQGLTSRQKYVKI